MGDLKLLTILMALSLVLACGEAEPKKATNSGQQPQIVLEADSLSIELSASGDSLELKVGELEALLDSLNN